MDSPRWASASRPRRQRIVKYIVTLTAALLIFTFFTNTIFDPSGIQIQHKRFRTRRSDLLAQSHRQRAVRKEFLHAWYGYKDHSWMADSLQSLTGERRDQFCGWSATLVDSLDTLWIMGLKDEFDNAVNATLTIDFARTAESCEINLFESTIRYLGGMLAAYDLSGDQRLLVKLVELGDILYGQFRTTNGMPCNHCMMIQPSAGLAEPSHNVPLADVGSFYLEFTRLWQVTGDKKYYEVVTFLTSVFESTQNSSSIPGLWPERVDSGSFTNTSAAEFTSASHTYSLGALSDSAYEYLPKTHLLLGGITSRYAEMWQKAADAIRSTLLFRAYIPQWNTTDALFSGLATQWSVDDELYLEPRIQHLGCFAGGMFAMSSRIFQNPSDLEIARQLTEGCIWAYANSPIGIMPETVTLLNCPDMNGPQCAWNQTVWDATTSSSLYPPGFVTSIDMKYLLRPEAIESVFYLYRITGDEYYRDVGWDMFSAIIAQTRTSYGHAALSNVLITSEQIVYDNGVQKKTHVAPQMDDMESFWLAETLKYFWLLFADPNVISLDEWVLNTEAHPLRLTRGVRAE